MLVRQPSGHVPSTSAREHDAMGAASDRLFVSCSPDSVTRDLPRGRRHARIPVFAKVVVDGTTLSEGATASNLSVDGVHVKVSAGIGVQDLPAVGSELLTTTPAALR